MLATQRLLNCLSENPAKYEHVKCGKLSPDDWYELVRESVRHTVTSLLYYRLKEHGLCQLTPAGVNQTLRDTYVLSAAKNMRIYTELTKVLRTFTDVNIPVIVLKGVHLAELVYGNIALRSMLDVDLLVRKVDLVNAAEKLMELGYTTSSPFWINVESADAKHLPPFEKPGVVPIEIHWNIVSSKEPFTIDIEALWERSRTVVILGKEVRVLSPEDLMLHLCIHSTYTHRFSIGIRLCFDIAEMYRCYKNDMDWNQVVRRAHQWGAIKSMRLALFMTRDITGINWPVEILESLKVDDIDSRVIAKSREKIFGDFDSSFSLNRRLAALSNHGRLKKKVALILRRIFLSRNDISIRYSVSPDSPFVFLYYPVRLVHLLVRYIRVVWRILCRDKEIMAQAERENALEDWLANEEPS